MLPTSSPLVATRRGFSTQARPHRQRHDSLAGKPPPAAKAAANTARGLIAALNESRARRVSDHPYSKHGSRRAGRRSSTPRVLGITGLVLVLLVAPVLVVTALQSLIQGVE